MVFCSIPSDVGWNSSKDFVRTSHPYLFLEWAVVFVELFAQPVVSVRRMCSVLFALQPCYMLSFLLLHTVAVNVPNFSPHCLHFHTRRSAYKCRIIILIYKNVLTFKEKFLLP